MRGAEATALTGSLEAAPEARSTAAWKKAR
jgi:hypothetical protein